jgi:cysteine desulfurase
MFKIGKYKRYHSMIMLKPLIYLDNNSTTRIDDRVLETIIPFFTDNYANANSTHKFGHFVHEAVEKARQQVAELIGAESNEIIFTSGATEAINLSLKGVADGLSGKGNHIVTVATEHSAVLDTCRYLENNGFRITYLPVMSDGMIDLNNLKKSLSKETILVSAMYSNNETGVINPISEISSLAHEVDALFMTDSTQAIGKIPLNVADGNYDLMCFSGHKFYAPKGIGALYIRKRGSNRVKLSPLLHGGGHEGGLRSGTLNVPGIVGLGSACAFANIEMNKNMITIGKIRNYLENELLKIEGTTVNGNTSHRMFNITNICFEGIDSNAMIMGLSNADNDLPLIAVSNGSACTSASIEPSHVLTSMGLNKAAAFSSIRFSLGKGNTKEEIDVVIDVVKNVVRGLRANA